MKYDRALSLPPHAALALERLEKYGYEAWCVGGCVRDSLLGLSPADWDIATNAAPQEASACFGDFPTIDIGAKHGTVAVVIDAHLIEITTYRADGDYADHRHPAGVRFSQTLEEDLSRRDFTVNAIAYHPHRGLRDEFGGLEDLERRVLRCVGRPARRFEEDALRILRCLRFSSTLGFSIEEETAGAVKEKAPLLLEISHERVKEELTKLLCGQGAGRVLKEYAEVIFQVLPELRPMKGCGQENPYHCFDVWEHTLRVVDNVPNEKELRWAALLHDCGKPAVKAFGPDGVAHFYRHEPASEKLAAQVLERLRFSNREKKEILELVRCHGEIHPISEKRAKKLLSLLGERQAFRLIALSRGDLAGQASQLFSERAAAIDQSESLLREALAQSACLTLRDLAVSGKDLMELGYQPGPALGRALDALLDAVLGDELPNEKAALLEKAGELLTKERRSEI